jgi:hypothetical protein
VLGVGGSCFVWDSVREFGEGRSNGDGREGDQVQRFVLAPTLYLDLSVSACWLIC